jgi:beta-lactamase class A
MTNKFMTLGLISAALILVVACEQRHATNISSPSSTPLPSPLAVNTGCAPDGLRKQMETIARASEGRVGAAAMIVETGEVVAFNGAERFPMQSVYKLPIAMAVLHEIDKGSLSLKQKVKVEPKDFVSFREYSIQGQFPQGAELSVSDLLRFMISESDGTACDALLRLVGGPAQVTKYLRELGIQGIVVANYEKEMADNNDLPSQNWATPEAMSQLLKMLQEGQGTSSAGNELLPSTSHRQLLLELMTTSRPGPNRIKGRLPSGTSVAHKTGSGRMLNGMATATNDVGLITLPDGRHLALAVFVSDAKAKEKMREEVIAKIARASWDCWTPGKENLHE